MGQEVVCAVRLGGRRAEGKALLETDELLFRGEPRLRIPFSEIQAVEAADGELGVTFPGGTAVFELGARAERWAERIRNPPTLADKLGVRPGMRVSVLGAADPELAELLRGRGADVSLEERDGSSLVFLRADSSDDLARIASLEQLIERDGAVWVVSPRGRDDLTERDVLAAGREAGLVDTKVARFSDTHTAHRFSIPRSRR